MTNEEDGVKVIQEFEEIIKNKKKWYHIVSLLSGSNIPKV